MTREEFEREYELELQLHNWERIDSIETDRLILRPMLYTDAKDLLEIVSNYDTAYWAGMEPLNTTSEIEKFVDMGNFMDTEPQFGIVLKDTGILIGAIGYFFDCYGLEGDTCVGYFLSEKYRGNGYMTEALKAVCNRFFENTFCSRLKCEIRPDNLPSRAVAKKCGFVQNPDQTRWRLNIYDKPLDEFFLYNEVYDESIDELIEELMKDM
ncbi:MAG: GNAT family N-acetyltransferase [Bacteroidales bacterium]|nr:GNAT family N-acetyltransferase [Bacteroidales bacterium]